MILYPKQFTRKGSNRPKTFFLPNTTVYYLGDVNVETALQEGRRNFGISVVFYGKSTFPECCVTTELTSFPKQRSNCIGQSIQQV